MFRGKGRRFAGVPASEGSDLAARFGRWPLTGFAPTRAGLPT
jgi:hypothetical protein